MKAIRRALGLGDNDRIKIRNGSGVTVSGARIGENVPLDALADGFRVTFQWIMDLFAHAIQAKAIDDSGNVQGILLIDEVEQHLHPRLQTSTMDRLAALFPKMQIIATTHSAQVALGVEPEELVALERANKYVRRLQPTNFCSYSVEDMLTDPDTFAAEAYSPEVNELLAHYTRVIAIPPAERSRTQREDLATLREQLSALEVIPDVNLDRNSAAILAKELLEAHQVS